MVQQRGLQTVNQQGLELGPGCDRRSVLSNGQITQQEFRRYEKHVREQIVQVRQPEQGHYVQHEIDDQRRSR